MTALKPALDAIKARVEAPNSGLAKAWQWQKKNLAKADERFFSYVNYSDDCWEWTGTYIGKPPRHYGSFYFKGRAWVASRWSYEYFVEPIPAGYFVCHHCDNPACVNPFHLFIGTQTDNMRDCSSKGRINLNKKPQPLKTHCKNGHEFTVENTLKTRDRGRVCKKCAAKWKAAHFKRTYWANKTAEKILKERV